MRPGRAAVLAALPVLALLGVQHGAAPLPSLVSAGSGGPATVTAAAVQVVADGRPQPIRLATVPARAASPARQAAARPVTHIVARTRQATAAQVAPAPFAVPVAKRSSTTDAYPYRTDTSGGLDAWGFTRRQCVSYAAWRLAEAGRPLDNARDGWGSALDWDTTARRLGFTVTTRPAVGAVAQWDAGERGDYWSPGASASDGVYVAGPAGHVGWVTEVYSDGSVRVAQYNGSGDRTFSTMRVRAPRYLRL